MNAAILSCEAIAQAHATIDAVFLNTPQFELDALNTLLNTRLILKVETLNPIRSFKGRGTDYFVKQQAQAAFVCASAGNFGQGMAYACRQHQIPLTVFAATTANSLKLERMRQLGAEVQLAGEDFDAAKAAGKAYATAQGLTYVEDGREPEVTIGAGTIGFELSQYPDPIDTLLIPVGNGALINGQFKVEVHHLLKTACSMGSVTELIRGYKTYRYWGMQSSLLGQWPQRLAAVLSQVDALQI